jgi:ATP-binding cassette, subfamily C, bacteriocin exporter
MNKIKKIFHAKLFKPKFPVIRQYDQIDCGPAALLSVLKLYGGNASLVSMRELCETTTQGSTMLDLVKAAQKVGFKAFGAKGEYEDLKNEKMPCIAHVVLESGLNHFVVIYKINSKRVLIGDPGKGIYKLKKEEILKIWHKKSVILLQPDSKLYNSDQTSWIKWITNYLKKNESWVYQTVFLGIVYTVLGLLTALFVQQIIDKFIPERDLSKIIFTGLFLLVLLIIRSLAGYFRQRFLIILNKRVNININSDFLSHIFQIPKRFFDSRKTGDITARINDSMRIQQAILLVTNTTIIDGLVIVGSFSLMFFIAPILAWISIVLVPAYSFILFFKTKTIKDEQNEVMKGHAKVESSYIDSLRGIDDILDFNVSRPFTILNKSLFEHFQSKIEKLGFTQANLSLSAELFGTIITVFLLSLGAIFVAKGNLLLGQMMAAYSLLTNILPAIGRFVGANISLQGANIAAQRLRDILLVEKEKNQGKLFFKMDKKITIEKGSFSWTKSKHLFDDLSLSIEKGKIISLWGKSGAGKSTLVQILERKYQLNSGQLLVDNIPAEEIDLTEYRKNISVIPQTIKIFNGTITDNIIIGRDVKSLDEIGQRIQQLGMETFFSRFEYGLFTLLGEDGRKLSGGEKQMLALIRALFDLPEVLIIDEGFSAIDIEIENLIFNSLKEYSKNHGVLIVTHDLRTISKTDFLYILENGSISEKGKPNDLLKMENSQFKKLIALQQLNYNSDITHEYTRT